MQTVQQNRQQQAALQAQQAQQQWQNQLTQKREQREATDADKRNQFMDAQMAQMQAQTARWRHEDALHDQEAHDAHNKAAQVLVNTYTDPKVGGRAPVDGAVPETLTASELASKYVANPKIRTSSDPNYVRHFIDTTDTSEVTWSGAANGGKGGWVNETDGTPVNMTDHTMFRVIDVPRDTMTTKVMTSGKDLNALEQLPGGQKLYDDDEMYPVSPLDKNALFQRGQDRRLEQAKVAVESRRVGAAEHANAVEERRQKEAEYKGLFDTVSEANKSLESQLKDEMDPAKRSQISTQIATNNQRLLDKYNEIYPAKKGSAALKQAPPPPEQKPDTSTPSGLLSTVKSYAPAELQPMVEKYIKGGTFQDGSSVPAAATYHDFVSNLATSQARVPAEARLAPADYQKILDTGKSYYDNLPKVQEKTQQDTTAIKLANARAKNPGKTITEANLADYDAQGNYLPVVPQSRFAKR